jgi:hypothetical protein
MFFKLHDFGNYFLMNLALMKYMISHWIFFLVINSCKKNNNVQRLVTVKLILPCFLAVMSRDKISKNMYMNTKIYGYFASQT